MRMWPLGLLLVTLSLSAARRVAEMNNKNGIVDVPSNHSVDETVDRLKGILQSKGITLFALIDHSGEAAKVGMTMRPTKLLIFGNPKLLHVFHGLYSFTVPVALADSISCSGLL